MCSASNSIRAVALLILSNLYGAGAFPQTAKFIRDAVDPLPLVSKPLGRAPCTKDYGGTASVSYIAAASAGDTAAPCNTVPVSVPAVNRCIPARELPSGCAAPKDQVREELVAQGKAGQKILRARDRVLEILQTENACSAWFREKDPSAADSFRTVSYDVDRHGEDLIRVSKAPGSQFTFRDPYVAQVGQDTGAYSTITLNARGAFFQSQVPTLVVSEEELPARIGVPRTVNIGPYPGDSQSARTLVLLHEFGHVINLLPVDFENEGGKSVQNTAEVLRYCRAEIDSKGRRGTLQAAR